MNKMMLDCLSCGKKEEFVLYPVTRPYQRLEMEVTHNSWCPNCGAPYDFSIEFVVEEYRDETTTT